MEDQTASAQSQYLSEKRDAWRATLRYRAYKACEEQLAKVKGYFYKPFENAEEITKIKKEMDSLKVELHETYNKSIADHCQSLEQILELKNKKEK